MSGTPRLALPFLSPGQAQKEFTHNEALQTLDFLIAGAVEEAPRPDPPATPTVGACYIVGDSATGAWAGKSQAVAGYSTGGWRLIAPLDGMSAYVKASKIWISYQSGSWELGAVRGLKVMINGEQIIGSRGVAIASPAGGSTVDAEARSSIDQILAALRTHGLIES
jgi:hypothetical protein